MKRTMLSKQLLAFILLVALVLIVGSWSIVQYALPAGAPNQTPISPQTSQEEEIRTAVETAIEAEKPQALALLLYDTQIEQITVSADGNWATAWLVPIDPASNQVVPMEPGLALVHKTTDGWLAFLPSDPLWPLVVLEVPDDLIPPEEKSVWSQVAEFRAAAVTAPIGGYYLPWAGGDTMTLTQSVGHDRYTPSGNAHFSFDFAKPGYPSGMFNVVAARGGTVKQAVWSHSNGDPVNTNYIVLEDTSTSPVTYQLYMHLAKDSIPAQLRVIGAPVQRGRLIGIADDTGVSSGNHLHFMVHTNATSYWGTSIDITFEDVNINGGRPRITSDLPYCRSSDVCDSTQSTYVSGNFMSPDHIPPTGGITGPPHGSLISTDVLPLQGWASDENSGIGSVQFLARYGGEWHPLGSPFSSTSFSLNWDMCADQVPDGPVSLALTIRDKAQNQASGLPGLIHFSKNFACPVSPSTCVPTANQIALFADLDNAGECVLLSAGSYGTPSQFDRLGDDKAASIIVGSNLQATLFSEANFSGRGETFFASDSSLKDNHIGVDTMTSVLVQSRTAGPGVPTLVWPVNNANYPGEASISLVWEDTRGATQFQLELLLGSSQVMLTPWTSQSFWHLSALTPGNYTWRVKARNGNGASGWSSSRNLQINPPSQPTANIVNAPFVDTMETTPSTWLGANWILASEANHTEGGARGWRYDVGSPNGYDTGNPNTGYLTSPIIVLPGSGVHYLRFYYKYETEGDELDWDQRWLQISVNGGPFTNILQLSDDPMDYWLRSPAISLASHAGQNIQVRFYFATMDSAYNQFSGWSIDDFAIDTVPPPACSDNNNTVPQAITINYGATLDGAICPGGDVDYYKFQGAAGDRIGILTKAQSIGSPLDTQLALIDIDGSSTISSNDDIVQFERTDSFVSYQIVRTGTYYIAVKAWDHPNAGGTDAIYNLSLYKDHEDPTASFLYPREGSSIPGGRIMLNIAARDTNSGVGLVRFFWHSSDWQNSNWNYLGEDWDPSDGWNFELDTATVGDRNGMAVYAVVFDWAGNWVGTGAWNLTPPVLYLPIIIKPR